MIVDQFVFQQETSSAIASASIFTLDICINLHLIYNYLQTDVIANALT